MTANLQPTKSFSKLRNYLRNGTVQALYVSMCFEAWRDMRAR